MDKKGIDIDDNLLSVGSNVAEPGVFAFDYRWFNVLWIVMVGSMLLFVIRVFYIAIVKHDVYASTATGNTLYQEAIIAPRGKIIASDGEVLVDNKPNYSAVVMAQYIADDKDDAQSLSEILAMPEDRIRSQIAEVRNAGINGILKERLSHDDVVLLESDERVPDYIRIEKNARRVYHDAPFFAHIIGYEGLIKEEEHAKHPEYLLTDRIGKTGLEYQYETFLHGTHGTRQSLRDSRARITKQLAEKAVVPGDDLYVHIDAALQKYLTTALMEQLERADTNRAAAVAIDPRTGAVRALVSLPSYDNNVFADGIDAVQYSALITDADKPLFNRAITGAYPPGSTVKPVMAIAALEEGIIDPQVQIESRGGLQYGRFFFGDWRVHGFTDMRRAIAVSSDVYFYTVGGGYGDVAGLGIERMYDWYGRFGYGVATGIDLPHEAQGNNPKTQWKEEKIGERWYIGDTYHSSIGQGFMTATPLQVAMTVATIANGGTVYRPQIAQKTVSYDGSEKIFPPQVVMQHVADEESLRIVREGMRETVTEGTAQMLQSIETPIAGKTGTAEFGKDDRVHSWFVGFAPYDHPELVLLIMVEGQTGTISSSTVPVARDVYQWYFGGRSTQESLGIDNL